MSEILLTVLKLEGSIPVRVVFQKGFSLEVYVVSPSPGVVRISRRAQRRRSNGVAVEEGMWRPQEMRFVAGCIACQVEGASGRRVTLILGSS